MFFVRVFLSNLVLFLNYICGAVWMLFEINRGTFGLFNIESKIVNTHTSSHPPISSKVAHFRGTQSPDHAVSYHAN